MSTYSKANTTAQWFQDNYGGARMDPNAGVIHTTETSGWPGYSGGATAPNYTAQPNIARKRLDWRAHFADECSSRALQNLGGGVETNTLNVIQVELIGTCDWSKRDRWGDKRAGVDYIYWPDAPDWALRDLAHFLADMHRRHGIKLQAPKVWLAYGPDKRRPDGKTPASYGAHPFRFTFAEWRNFYGWCGHQHVPENVHGDPGKLPMDRVLDMAQELLNPGPPPTPRWDDLWEQADRALKLANALAADAPKDSPRAKALAEIKQKQAESKQLAAKWSQAH